MKHEYPSTRAKASNIVLTAFGRAYPNKPEPLDAMLSLAWVADEDVRIVGSVLCCSGCAGVTPEALADELLCKCAGGSL